MTPNSGSSLPSATASSRFGHRAIPIVLAAVTVDVIGFGIVMPVLPGLIVRLAQVDLTEATRISGWMLAVFAVAQFFAGPVLGNLGDRFGRRPVLIASMLAFSADYALMAWSPSIAWLFLGRVIAGITGATFGPVGAVIADVTPPERRASNFGLLSASFGIGFIVGPALGGIVAMAGPRMPFWLAAGLGAANALTMYVLLPETLAPRNRRPFRLRDSHVVGAFRPLFVTAGAGPLLIAWFLWQLGIVVYPATWAFWASLRFGWSATGIGWSLAWTGFLHLLVQLTMTKMMVARLGERGAAILGLAIEAATLTAMAFVTRGWHVYAVFLVGALGALTWPALNGMFSRLVDATRQGALQGGLGSLNSIAAMLGPIVATQSLALSAQHGFDGAAFIVAGGLIGGAMLLVAAFAPKPESVSPGPPAA